MLNVQSLSSAEFCSSFRLRPGVLAVSLTTFLAQSLSLRGHPALGGFTHIILLTFPDDGFDRTSWIFEILFCPSLDLYFSMIYSLSWIRTVTLKSMNINTNIYFTFYFIFIFNYHNFERKMISLCHWRGFFIWL